MNITKRTRRHASMGRAGVVGVTTLIVGLVLAACSSSPSATTKPPASNTNVPQLSITSFTRNFSAMSKLKSLAAKGKGSVTAILPDTVSSARYTEFDAPYLTKAFETAGLKTSQFTVLNAQGSYSTELSDAQSAITNGASVLIVDPLDSGVGTAIEKYAKSHGVDVIDYDRLTLGGTRKYYVSFNNVQVGVLIGKGFVSCASAWGVTKPDVLVTSGDPTDNNATLFRQGYLSVLNPLFAKGTYIKAGQPAGTWNPPTALTTFQQALTADKSINSAIIPNDENGAPIITYLKTLGVKAKTFPLTGQDATLTGLQNILSGYQCGTVYKPIYEEAQAAVALAIYARAGVNPPSALVNGKTDDSVSKVEVDSVLLHPEWVTPSNMNSTVIADNFVPASQLCAGAYAADCKSAGISS
jgi:D-xylose transport system substrate-binding protein